MEAANKNYKKMIDNFEPVGPSLNSLKKATTLDFSVDKTTPTEDDEPNEKLKNNQPWYSLPLEVNEII